MVSKVSQSTTMPTGQTGTEALFRNEQVSQSTSDKSAAPSASSKKLDTSYELNLSEAAQAKLASSASETDSPEKARKQMDLIKSAMGKSTTSLASLHKTNTQSVMDLLA